MGAAESRYQCGRPWDRDSRAAVLGQTQGVRKDRDSRVVGWALATYHPWDRDSLAEGWAYDHHTYPASGFGVVQEGQHQLQDEDRDSRAVMVVSYYNTSLLYR